MTFRWLLAVLLVPLLSTPVTIAATAQTPTGEWPYGVWVAQRAEQPGQADRTARLDRAILDDPTRPVGEREQDPGRRVLQLYEWLGVEPGMTVADLWAGRGYNTHLLSRVVGDAGVVVAHLGFVAEAFGAGLRQRVLDARLDNVRVVDEIEEIEPASLDLALAVRNYHDVGWVRKELSREATVAAIYRALKPGGRVGIVEAATDSPGWDAKAHRLNEAVVIGDFLGGGFELVGRADLLRNDDDDRGQPGWGQRHAIDRYVLQFRKPLSGADASR